MDYCVAIRTLGTAGKKYQILLDSLNRQSFKPKKILVYIPYEYELPKETIGWEEYVRCNKGMITQRSLPFNEIDTDYILFCDDDISLEETSVERLFKGLLDNNGDCISPNTFPVNQFSTIGKIKKAIAAYTFPRKDDGWAFKIMRNGSYTYNNKPKKEVLPTESAAGPCMLIKKSAYHAIHFEDERWIEQFGYALGDDLLFYHKLFIMGYHVLIHYNSGIIHLDAGTSSSKLPSDWIKKSITLSFIVQYRIKYSLKKNTNVDKCLCIWSNLFRYTEQYLFIFIKQLIKNKRIVFYDFVSGLRDGFKYVKSTSYQNIPSFDAYID